MRRVLEDFKVEIGTSHAQRAEMEELFGRARGLIERIEGMVERGDALLEKARNIRETLSS
jgi:hypothetical protein